MRLGKYGKIFHHDCVALGQGHIDRYTLVELKPLGGIILNIFNSVEQDRFHTHAFNSISLMLRGTYREEILGSGFRIRHGDICYLPRTLEHRILDSTKNAMSITLCGPWKSTWTETSLTGKIRKFHWGRRRAQT